MRNAVLSALLATVLSCASAPPPPSPAGNPPVGDPRIAAMAFSRDRSTLWFAIGNERCEMRALAIETKMERAAFALDRCPSSITVLEDESLVVSDGSSFGVWKRSDGTDVISGSGVLAAAGASNYVLIRGDRLVWRHGENEKDVGARGSVRVVKLLPVTGVLLVVRRSAEGERVVRITAEAETEVSPPFPAIDSVDVAPRGDEIVFSARREKGFDVAIASTDGKTVNWVAPDPADEVGVTWAPRGNKVSFLIRGLDSTLVRSVHVPTSFQLTFDTPYLAVRGLAWEPRAERFAMSLDGPGASPHVDWIEYGGGKRETLVPPASRLKSEPERVAFGTGSGLLLPPSAVRYGETLPLFVRLTDDPLAWSAELRDLDSLGGGILIVPAAWWGDGSPLATLPAESKWIDPGAIVVIDPGSALKPDAVAGFTKGQTLLALGTKQPPGRVFSQRGLPGGGSGVSAESWQGAMAYLRERFRAKR